MSKHKRYRTNNQGQSHKTNHHQHYPPPIHESNNTSHDKPRKSSIVLLQESPLVIVPNKNSPQKIATLPPLRFSHMNGDEKNSRRTSILRVDSFSFSDEKERLLLSPTNTKNLGILKDGSFKRKFKKLEDNGEHMADEDFGAWQFGKQSPHDLFLKRSERKLEIGMWKIAG